MSNADEERDDHPPRRRSTDALSFKLVISLTATVAAVIGLLTTMLVNLSKSNDRLIDAVVKQMETQHTDNLQSQRETRAALTEFGAKQQQLSETLRQAYHVDREARIGPRKPGRAMTTDKPTISEGAPK